MPRRTLAVTATFAWFVAGVAAQDEYVPKPVPAGPDAYTGSKHANDREAFWSGLLQAECKRRDGYKEAWRPELEATFGAFSRWWNESSAVTRGPEVPRGNATGRRLERAVALFGKSQT